MNKFYHDENGDAVVEAAILFPIMMMIFAALVLLAFYLPTRSALQRATQIAASAVATEMSDTWLGFNEDTSSLEWMEDDSNMGNVYMSLFNSILPEHEKYKDNSEKIVTNAENSVVSIKSGDLTVECTLVNYFVYKEIKVTATRTIPVPINLSFIGFPTKIPITVTSIATVQNGDEFIRNIDIATDFLSFVKEKLGENETVGKVFEKIDEFKSKITEFLGW
jgi:hypothetical protein